MSPQPLPTSRQLLEELFRSCNENYDSVFRGMQRDQARMVILWNCLVGELTPDEMELRRKELETASNAARDRGLPSFEFLLPFLDSQILADAERKEAFADAAAEGNARMRANPWFIWMIVAGYDAIVRGHLGRLNARELRKRLEAVLEGCDVPVWNPESGKLLFRGEITRAVRENPWPAILD